jgi:AcrR family transcriptional regulator
MIERADTKTRILDSAEKLFGINGFEATSLRDITAEADANLAAVNYHFQSKESLIDAVISRRIEPINRRRLELLDQSGEHPSVEEILTAFLAPVFEQELSAAIPLLGRMLADPAPFVDRVFKRHFTELARRFLEALHRSLPELPPDELLWRLHFMIGSMTHILTWGPVLGALTGGLCDVSDRGALLRRGVAFHAAAFRSPVAAGTIRERTS